MQLVCAIVYFGGLLDFAFFKDHPSPNYRVEFDKG